MSFATFSIGSGDLAVLSARGALPLRGAWAWEVELDATDAEAPYKGASGALGVGGRSFVGYVRDVQAWQGRARLILEAGRAGMRTDVTAQGYASVLVSTLVAQAVQDAGEQFAVELEPGAVLDRWARPAGPAGAALSAICAAAGLGWRFTDGGAVLVAAEAWTEADEGGVLELEPDGADASLEVAPLAATLNPGTTWRGRRIERVVYHLPEGESLLARLVYERTEAPGDMRGLFERAVRTALRELPLMKRFACTVESQDAAGRLELVPDDDAMPGTPPASVLYGLPGARAVVDQGARVGLVHDGAEASRPRAEGWEQATPAREIHLDASDVIALAGAAGGLAGLHRIGDTSDGGRLTAVGAALGYSGGPPEAPVSWVLTAAAGATPVTWVLTPTSNPADVGRIVPVAATGSTIVKAGG